MQWDLLKRGLGTQNKNDKEGKCKEGGNEQENKITTCVVNLDKVVWIERSADE